MANQKHNEEVLRRAQEGDIIRFRRRRAGFDLYDHYGIYIGHEEVVHWASDIVHKAVIRKQKFSTVTREHRDKADIDNMLDKWLTPFPAEKVVTRALGSVDERGYNLLKANCEHFATWCRYDYGSSKQVEEAGKKVKGILENCQLSETERQYYSGILVLLSFPMKMASDEKSQTPYYESSYSNDDLGDRTSTDFHQGQGNITSDESDYGLGNAIWDACRDGLRNITSGLENTTSDDRHHGMGNAKMRISHEGQEHVIPGSCYRQLFNTSRSTIVRTWESLIGNATCMQKTSSWIPMGWPPF
ncbi:hypothetical protein BaRGS_00021555 [Batillaria attramentaria]|uniref:LRAT domain-containing protein n=1 Tax=Batillaria attramentaria TaxID=370345 RepID=A0ABD0KJP0_9CAEN